jgi:predicted transcriptional regulator
MTLSEIMKKLQKKAFTQAPVTFGDHIIGVITLNKIYELLNTPNFDKNTALGKKHVIEVLTIPYDHPIGNLGKTLQSEPCLLVEKDGKKYGIITIEDIVTNL